MFRPLKRLVRDSFGLAGLELRRKTGSRESSIQPGSDPFDMQRALVGPAARMIVDLGAHHGNVALKYRSLFPQATIHAFEPFLASWEIARQQTSHDAQLHVHQLAVSDCAGELTFHANAKEYTNSLLPTQHTAAEIWGEGRLETVSTHLVTTVTLDQFCEDHRISKIDILKLDVQGAEFRVFQGAERLLRGGHIGLIYLEIIVAQTYDGQRPIHEYLSLLAGYQYELKGLFNIAQTNTQLLQLDAVFQSRSTPAVPSTGL